MGIIHSFIIPWHVCARVLHLINPGHMREGYSSRSISLFVTTLTAVYVICKAKVMCHRVLYSVFYGCIVLENAFCNKNLRSYFFEQKLQIRQLSSQFTRFRWCTLIGKPLEEVSFICLQCMYKFQPIHSEHPWYFCSGGFPEESSEAPRTLSILRGKSISLLSSSSTILDFVCLPSSPYPYRELCSYPCIADFRKLAFLECQKPFALVILSKNELIFHDLLTPT